MKGTENFEQEVREYLIKHRYVKRQDLKDYLIETHPKSEYSGYSDRTIDRRLSQMREDKTIRILKKGTKKQKFGIPDSGDLFSYIILFEEINYSEMFDILIEKIIKEVPNRKNLIEEIYEYHQAAPLNQIELDSIVEAFGKIYKSLDDESIDMMLDLFVHCIIIEKIKPRHGFVLKEILETILEKFSEKNEIYPDLRKNILTLMGYYNLKGPVINQLKTDAYNLEKPTSVESDYTNDALSTVIVGNLNYLLDLKLELKQEGKVEAVKLINNVMYHFRKPIDNKDNIQ
ncbi:hypothetical protein [Methanococcoides alaskense]|uniref:Uncharacterized protein n=1 Tax=Methanococcoides alaskense TaxID=325778 RepID=A0AA90ZAL2_9EURY|nr:hypothetical protein [Methanococcoides alaskense]MDA0525490.1 hypothetical protein [Methanococcoides alaskense]MDR6221572.1 hypothetical protein [Methanococcoides alaskense]